MKLNVVDLAVIGGYFVIIIGIGIYFSKRAGKSMEDFFLSGRALPWWVAGTSIAATGFAADTPFMVTELVRRNGIAGNWFLWCFALTNLCATFLFFRFLRFLVRAEHLNQKMFVMGLVSAWLGMTVELLFYPGGSGLKIIWIYLGLASTLNGFGLENAHEESR